MSVAIFPYFIIDSPRFELFLLFYFFRHRLNFAARQTVASASSLPTRDEIIKDAYKTANINYQNEISSDSSATPPKNESKARFLRDERRLIQKNSGLVKVKRIEYEVTVTTGNINGAGMYLPGTLTINIKGTEDEHEARFSNADQHSVVKQENCFARGQETLNTYATCLRIISPFRH